MRLVNLSSSSSAQHPDHRLSAHVRTTALSINALLTSALLRSHSRSSPPLLVKSLQAVSLIGGEVAMSIARGRKRRAYKTLAYKSEERERGDSKSEGGRA